MNNKKVKELTRLLNRKLESLGIADETKLKQSGQKRRLVFENGNLVEKQVPVNVLQNLKKQMVKRILEGGEHAVRAFIATDNKALQGALDSSPDNSPSDLATDNA